MELLFFAWRELRASLRARDSFGRRRGLLQEIAVRVVRVIDGAGFRIGGGEQARE